MLIIIIIINYRFQNQKEIPINYLVYQSSDLEGRGYSLQGTCLYITHTATIRILYSIYLF